MAEKCRIWNRRDKPEFRLCAFAMPVRSGAVIPMCGLACGIRRDDPGRFQLNAV